MGIGEGLGAAFEAIGNALMEGSKRDYELKKKKTADEDYENRQVRVAERIQKLPQGQATLAATNALAKKREGGGAGGGRVGGGVKTASGGIFDQVPGTPPPAVPIAPAALRPQFTVGQIINKGGKSYKYVGNNQWQPL